MKKIKSIPIWKQLDREIGDIEKIYYDIESLEISVNYGHNKILIIKFKQPRGFRVLDEGDLLEFFPNCSFPSGSVFEIIEVGWYELESLREYFSSKTRDYKEYFIISSNECVSVITFFTPEIYEK